MIVTSNYWNMDVIRERLLRRKGLGVIFTASINHKTGTYGSARPLEVVKHKTLWLKIFFKLVVRQKGIKSWLTQTPEVTEFSFLCAVTHRDVGQYGFPRISSHS